MAYTAKMSKQYNNFVCEIDSLKVTALNFAMFSIASCKLFDMEEWCHWTDFFQQVL
jgi:hypothetical protein